MVCYCLQLHQSYRAPVPRAGLCLISTGAMNTRWPTDTTDDAIATQTFATVLPGELWWRWPVFFRFCSWPLFECLQIKRQLSICATLQLLFSCSETELYIRVSCAVFSILLWLVTVIRVHFVKLLRKVSFFHPPLCALTLLCHLSSSSFLTFPSLLWQFSPAGEFCELCQVVL